MVYRATINKVMRIPGRSNKPDIKRDIQQRIGDELADEGLVDVPIEYHMTSIFDHSIFEAFSKIIQKLIPQLHTLQDLLNNLVDVNLKSFVTDLDHGYTQGFPIRRNQ